MNNKESKWIDIGINLTDSAFNRDRETVIAEARSAGVTQLVITGTNIDSSEQALSLAQSQQLYSTAGIHPHHAKDAKTEDFDRLLELYQQPRIVAVGETGLDFNRDFSPRPIQEKVFEQQLQLACEAGLPLFMHEREAFQRFYPLIKSYRDHFRNGVVHCFTGTKSELFAYLDLDLHIGITGWICDERRGSDLKASVHNIPLDRLMIETDAPYLLPRDLQPKPKSRRNEPKYLPHIAATIADCYRIPISELAQRLGKNSCDFFGIDQV